MIINILGGGPANYHPDLKEFDSGDSWWLGVDKGVFTLLATGIKPDYAFGDFDSVTDEEWMRIKREVSNLHTFKPEKDETDMELALDWALTKGPEKIRIFGGTGGRLDHFLGNVQILLKAELNGLSTQIEMIDRQNQLFVKGPGSHTVEKMANLKYISFVPVTPLVKGLTLEQFKYPLNNCHISLGSTLCISNELVSDFGTFSFTEGIVLVIRSND
ncbi:thiamine diphosphokinase [Mesobacillus persicus]|uniref:Thiamine diphosphokinase n=1 Tax=Mesobacillus persicus TaxID=930146 RepID=A0A1H7YKN4_9BACI|nr:thiamine diphosphokinase [Mesobacillus persicus]SEM46802.1 thiamine diphosphokinase [Mesobacillus persicus]